MTASQLPRESPENHRAWTIVGSRHAGIVTHLAVLAENTPRVQYGSRVPVYHMGPPLTSLEPDVVGSEDSPESDSEDNSASVTTVVHVFARLDDLSDDERQGMRRWHRKVSAFFPATTRPSPPRIRPGQEAELARFFTDCRYIAHPAFSVEVDLVSGVAKYHRYSCVGFVTQCYESTAVKKVLIESDESDFPDVELAMVKRAFLPSKLEWTGEIAEAINLTGNGPWPIVMPGHVLRAFNRSDITIRNDPYSPTCDDVGFLGAE